MIIIERWTNSYLIEIESRIHLYNTVFWSLVIWGNWIILKIRATIEVTDPTGSPTCAIYTHYIVPFTSRSSLEDIRYSATIPSTCHSTRKKDRVQVSRLHLRNLCVTIPSSYIFLNNSKKRNYPK